MPFLFLFISLLAQARSDTACGENCDSCDGLKCTKCVDGFYEQLGKCLPCESTCKTCETVKSKCTSCEEGKFLEGSLCVDCLPNCKKCENREECLICDEHTSNTTASPPSTTCDKCPIYCDTCGYDFSFQPPQYCTSCAAGYRPLEEKGYHEGEVYCDSCSEGCLECPDAFDKCKKCMIGYILEGTTCQKCDPGCAECDGKKSNCQTCLDGYFKKNPTDNTCYKCHENCNSCINQSYCTNCKYGTYSVNGICTACDPSCSHCHDGTNLCDICADGYHFNTLKQCVQCSADCNECDDDGCTLCNSHFYLTKERTCAKCSDSCQECKETADGCIECEDGFYLSRSLQICLKCDVECSKCNGPGNFNSCSECSKGYFLSEDDDDDDEKGNLICTPCEPGCVSCSSLYQCDSCKEGYYETRDDSREDKDCMRCDLGCKKCIGPNKCQECFEGYFQAPNGEFVTCTQCPSHCKTCELKDSVFMCNECLDGYYLDNGKCSRCKTPCQTCDAPGNICKSCVKGHLLIGASCNRMCSSDCATCEGKPDNCTSCNNGYILIGNTCKKCREGCDQCEFHDQTSTCLSCAPGYAMKKNDGICGKCDSACNSCFLPNDRFACYDCSPGHYISTQDSYWFPYYTGYCQDCSNKDENCIDCTSDCGDQYNCKFICLKCADHFFINENGKCQSCDQSCKNCYGDGSNKCYECNEGFYNFEGTCTSCNPSCLSCGVNPTDCISCKSNFYLKDKQCHKCSDSCEECKGTGDYCTKCPNKKVAYAGKCIDSCALIGPGYGSTDQGATCEKCNLENCIEYDDSCQCVRCKDGYGVVTDPSTQVEICIKCSLDNCRNCTGTERNDCSECMPGFFLYTDANTQNKICTGCQIKNCKTCSGSGVTCEECNEKYYIDPSGQCQLCKPSNCLTCKAPGDDCEHCEDGYFNQNGKCQPCSSLCLTCEQSSNHCLTCIDGYELTKDFRCEFKTVGGESCEENKPCNVKNDEIKYASYRPNFKKYDTVVKENGNGGALHVINFNFKAQKTEFNGCKTSDGAGGAIYISNTIPSKSNINLDNVKFESCEANFGGGIYIYCPDEDSPVTIIDCTFEKCIANQKSGDFYGGSAIYMTVKLGSVDLCTFKGNIGTGGHVKVTDDFINVPKDQLAILNSNLSSVTVSVTRCHFEVTSNSDCSIYYSSKQKLSNIKVKKCEFRGKLAKGGHFIDGRSIDGEMLNLQVNNCKFDADQNSAINTRFIKVDSSNNEVKSTNFKLETEVLVGMSSAALIAIVAVTVAIIKRIKSNKEDEGNEMQDASSELVNA